jgi:hypothetical protein
MALAQLALAIASNSFNACAAVSLVTEANGLGSTVACPAQPDNPKLKANAVTSATIFISPPNAIYRVYEHSSRFGMIAFMHRIYSMPVSKVYPLYVAKLERKGRTVAELDEVMTWLTGFDGKQMHSLIDSGATFSEFFDAATINPKAVEITGVICGVRIEQIEDPLMQKIRYMDKLVDELYKGRPMTKVLRQA